MTEQALASGGGFRIRILNFSTVLGRSRGSQLRVLKSKYCGDI